MRQAEHIGFILKSLRQQQKLSLKDIARETCVSLSYLDAIEKGNHDALPSIAFSNGFIKSYATAVGYDPVIASEALKVAMVADQSDGENPVVSTAAIVSTADALPSKSMSPFVIAAFAGLAATVSVMMSGMFSSDVSMPIEPNKQVIAQKSAPKAINTAALNLPVSKKEITKAEVQELSDDTLRTAAITPSPKEQVALFPAAQASELKSALVDASTLFLVAREDSWVQITAIDGTLIFEGIMEAGQERLLDTADYLVTTANAGGLEVKQGSNTKGALGVRGVVVKDISISDIIDDNS